MLRVSLFVKSSAIALARGFALASCFACASANPPALASLIRPQRPLGSAAEIAVQTNIGAAATRVHSSEVKSALLDIGCPFRFAGRTNYHDCLPYQSSTSLLT